MYLVLYLDSTTVIRCNCMYIYSSVGLNIIHPSGITAIRLFSFLCVVLSCLNNAQINSCTALPPLVLHLLV